MKIKLAIMDENKSYLDRFSATLGTKYAEQLEIYSFTTLEAALPVFEETKIDVVLAGEDFAMVLDRLPARCGFAWLVESPDVGSIDDRPCICKYQRMELIYRQILGIYAEHKVGVSGAGGSDDRTKVLAFTSPAGGVGTSTLAAACAIHFAEIGKRCLYLCLDPFGAPELFFSGEGQSDLSDLVFALKSRKANFAIKLESCVKKSAEGVYFYAGPKVALDLLELSNEEENRMINELRQTGNYDLIVLDIGFGMDARSLSVYRQAQLVVWVSDGSESANSKVRKAYGSLEILGRQTDYPMVDQICLAYNRFSSKTGQKIDDLPVQTIGGARRYENRSIAQVAAELAKTDIFDHVAQD